MAKATQSVTLGERSIVALEVSWLPDRAPELAWGLGKLWVRGELAWATCRDGDEFAGIDWTWRDLLEFLAKAWGRICLEETYPAGFAPRDPAWLRRVAEARWSEANVTRTIREIEDEELYRFEGYHDLARATSGLAVPSVFILREGARMWVTMDDEAHLFDRTAVLSSLAAIGDGIAGRLGDDELVDQWRQRDRQVMDQRFALLSGLKQADLTQLLQGSSPLEFWDASDGENSDSELLAVARFSGAALSLSEKAELIERVRSVDSVTGSTLSTLDEVSSEAGEALNRAGTDLEDYEQGEVVADWLRAKLGLCNHETVDPGEVLHSWGIPVEDMKVAWTINGIGVWGRRRGPTVLVNSNGKFSSTPHGRRTTEAHELCHLLLDRKGALPFSEVLGGASPGRPERRANAFAACLLLPKQAAADIFSRAESVEAALKTTADRFRVGQQVAAWQILNGPLASSLKASERDQLLALARAQRNG